MAHFEIGEVKSELKAIEELINELCQRQAALCSRLATLEHPLDAVTATDAVPPGSSSTPSWATVVKGTKRLSLPLYDSFGPGYQEMTLSNFFSPLAALDSPPAPPPSKRTAYGTRKRSLPISTSPLNSASSSPAPPGHKRPRLTSTQLNQWPCSVAKSTQPLRNDVTTAHEMPSPPLPSLFKHIGPAVVDPCEASGLRTSNDHTDVASVWSAPQDFPNAVHSSDSVNLTKNSNILKQLPVNYIFLGDSIIRSVAIPNCITYSYSGAKIQDLVMYIPAIVEEHPTAHSIIIHVGINDIKCRQSIKLHYDLELLATTIESLGKKCIFSSILPSIGQGSEWFSRIYNANGWLENFCHACGYGFVNHFDIFWKNIKYYRDRIHLNNKGLDALSTNISSYLKQHQA